MELDRYNYTIAVHVKWPFNANIKFGLRKSRAKWFRLFSVTAGSSPAP